MSEIVAIQNSLNAGELSPSVWGRLDVDKWHKGTSTCRNFFADYRGGVTSRAGLEYISITKQTDFNNPPRLIPFTFNLTQAYVLEFGDHYTRFIFDGAYIVENGVQVTSVSTAGLFTTTLSHGYSVGDWINDVGNSGFTGLNWIIRTVPSANTFTVSDLFGNPVTSATASTGGGVFRIYTVVSPYAAVDLPYLKFTQSADVMTLTCVNTSSQTEYPPYDLRRFGNINWVFNQESFAATITSPTNITAVAYSSSILSTWYSYIVTAVNSITGEESNPSDPVNIQNNDIAVYAGTNSISWNSVSGASSYNIYASTPSYGNQVTSGNLYGFIGTSFGTNFNDTNIQPDFTVVPPQHFDPFARGAIIDVVPTSSGTNYSQSTISYNVVTSTGTGFKGQPVVTNGGLSGFVIQDEGSGYVAGDTITFSDTGGGLATGNFTFVSNITSGTIIFNGYTIEFLNQTDAQTATNQVYLGNTLALTLQALAEFLNASSSVDLNCATYLATPTQVIVTYRTPGTVGNAYTLNAGSSGGTASGTNLTGGGTIGSGATATLTIGPESNTYPSTVAYYQQRRVYGGSLSQPDTYWMSQPGLFNNMDTSIPTTSADAITGTPWAQQVNGIQWLVPMPGGLVVLTGKGAWQVNGGSQAAITPSDQTATAQAYNGANNLVQPLTVNYDILYVQAKGSIVRDLSYNFYFNIYTGNDLTIYSDHLFLNRQILQWAYAEEPYKLIWAVRDDGTLLCLTYLKEQEVFSWTRHDTNGLFKSVVSITEPPVDAIYVVVQRYLNNQWLYTVERMDNRLWSNLDECFCVDAGLRTTLTEPNAALTASAATGTNVTFTTINNVAAFSAGMVGWELRMGGGLATITSYASPSQVIGNISETITNTVPDNSSQLLYSPAGQWSVAPQLTVITGLNHLNNLQVAVLANGSVIPNLVVQNNQITLPRPASNVIVGLPYTCQVQTLYFDHPEQQTIQTKRKNIMAVGLRVEQTRGLQVGADQPDSSTQQNYAPVTWISMNEIKERTQFIFAGNPVPLYTGDYYKTVTAGWSETGQVAVQQVYPLPAKILSVVAYVSTGDDK